MSAFSPATQAWFEDVFDRATDVQTRGWPAIQRGAHSLLLAPTGSGKTLAAFLCGIDAVGQLPPDAPPGVRVLYVSPLKALVYDIERNLRAPLAGIGRTAERLQLPFRAARVDVRTGDTPQRDRARQRKDPGEIMVTTPESLFLLVGSSSRETLRTVHTIIIDEIHAVATSKRGVHLALTIERLSALVAAGSGAESPTPEPQRIGLSATVKPVEAVADFLGGVGREVEVIDTSAPPRLDLQVRVTVPDMEQPTTASDAGVEPGKDTQGFAIQTKATSAPSGSILGNLLAEGADPPGERRPQGIWPVVYPQLVQLIRAHRSTILFVNSRGLCERLARKLNELAEEEIVLAHHGSISHEQRETMEEALKAGKVPGIVATSSLELGIDMGAVDLVVMIESPGSVASGLQRVGRAGHGVGETSKGLLFPKHRGDLLESAVVARRMLRGELEPLRVPANALDVLAQQIVAMVCDTSRTVDEIEAIVRRATPYRGLTRNALVAVLDMLSGRYPSDDFADLRPRLAWDRQKDVLTARRGTPMISRLNGGTIPDRGLFAVHLGLDGPRIGELDEEMVYESRSGDVILLGASSWRVLEITRDRVVVEPAPGEPGRLPFWIGDAVGRPIELGRAIGAFLREIGDRSRADAAEYLRAELPLDEFAAHNLADYIHDQREHAGVLPSDQAITIERFRDELGDWRICILTPFGARVHAPWSLALQSSLSAKSGIELVTMYSDDGIVLTFADHEELPEVADLMPPVDELEELVTDQLSGSAMFGSNFRENAARALLLPKRNPRSRTPLWAQRLKSKNLLGTVQRFPDFPIVLETYRQCLQDAFDVPALRDLLEAVADRRVRVDYVETRSASPFARSLVFAYVAAYMYERDAPLAERRAQALTLDRNLLRELLGEAELRELIDPQVLAEVEADLQRIAENRLARDADELHDVLRSLGALTEPEVGERCTEDPQAWLAELQAARQACPVRFAGAERWIAAQDAGLYIEALGAMPPSGLPAEFLVAGDAPLESLCRRYARTHGPFLTEEIAAAFGMRPAQLDPVLQKLVVDRQLVRGAIRPDGHHAEWCHEDVLRQLKRRTLAKLRGQVAAVDASAMARFAPQWQGARSPTESTTDPGQPARGGAGATGRSLTLVEALAQLEGLPLPWSVWMQDVLPARVRDFRPEALDMLSATGEVCWVGRGSVGATDGRVAFYRRDQVALLLSPPEPHETSMPLHEALVERLRQRGACFTTELQRAARELGGEAEFDRREFEAALWDLVWAGLVTNDTFAPLRSLGRCKGRRGANQSARSRPGNVLAGGRWSLVEDLVDPDIAPTERAHGIARMLLERHGVVARETAQFEELPGGYGAIYGVLKAMEEAGRIRRGYFVEGLTGAQFALAGAVDRLRRQAPNSADACAGVWLGAAIDPAQPYGGVLPWPDGLHEGEPRPRRVPGAWVVTVDGKLCLWIAKSRRNVLTFAHDELLDRALSALEFLPGRRLVLDKVDGVALGDSPLRGRFEARGFVRDYRGWVRADGLTGA